MSLSKELEKIKYDKRLLDWHVSRGKISKEEVKKYLESLPDLATNVESFSLGPASDNDSFGGSSGGSSSGFGGSGAF